MEKRSNSKLKNGSFAAEQMVRDIMNGNNVNAYKMLERCMREKVADKIDSALKDA